MIMGVRDNHESPSIRRITRAKEESRCRKLGSKYHWQTILSIKIRTYLSESLARKLKKSVPSSNLSSSLNRDNKLFNLWY